MERTEKKDKKSNSSGRFCGVEFDSYSDIVSTNMVPVSLSG